MPINSFLYPGAKVTTPFSVSNSCRFNDGDSPSLSKTMVAGSTDFAKKFTISVWFKLGAISGARPICSFGSGTTDAIDLLIDNNSKAVFESWDGSVNPKLTTNRVLKDYSAWYNIVVAVDTTQGTNTNRMKMYINGVQETSFASSVYAAEDYLFPGIGTTNDTMKIGSGGQYNSNYFDGYMAEFVYCDGQVLSPTDFGEFDQDSPTIWKPKDVSGLTFGNAGTYCDFQDSGNLGDDESGNTNDLTENNIVAADQATDTPTNNFCVMNPLYAATSSAFTFAQGNCELTQNDTNWRTAAGTMGVSSGKWYFEAKGGQGANGYTHFGWASTSWLNEKGDGSMNEPGTNHNGPCVTYYGANGNNYYSTSSATGSNASYGNTWDNDHTIGCFLDLDNNKAYWSKDGTLQNSGTGYSIESGFTWLPIVGGYDMDNGGESVKVNFGGCPATTISSGNTDGEYGNFEYTTTITGDGSSKTFKALCTKNLAEYG